MKPHLWPRPWSRQGFSVLVSTATDIPLAIGNHPAIRRRSGLLDEPQLTRLLLEEKIRGVVDATHPYAEAIGPLARKVAGQLQLPYFRWLRPAALSGSSEILAAADHAEAATLAFSIGAPVLLTIGSKNLEPYVRESRKTGLPVIARILDHPDSRAACQKLASPRRWSSPARALFRSTKIGQLFGIFELGS